MIGKENKRGTAYGNIVIDCSIPSLYEWTINIIKCSNEWEYKIIFGIDSSNKQFINDNFCDSSKNKSNFYGYDTEGDIANCDDDPDLYDFVATKYKPGEGDTIKLSLNTQKKQLILFKNGKEAYTKIKSINIETKYYFAISMAKYDHQVKLIHFTKKLL